MFVVKTECEIVIGKDRLLQEPQDFWWPGCPQCEQWFCCELAIEVGLSVLLLELFFVEHLIVV